MAIKRIYAHESVYDELCDALVEEANPGVSSDAIGLGVGCILGNRHLARWKTNKTERSYWSVPEPIIPFVENGADAGSYVPGTIGGGGGPRVLPVGSSMTRSTFDVP